MSNFEVVPLDRLIPAPSCRFDRECATLPRMATDPVSSLAEYINAPALSYDWEFVSVYLDEEGIELPEGVDEYEAGDWLKNSEHSTDYETWFDNNVPELIYDGQIEWNPPTPYTDARSDSGWFIHFTPSQFVTFADGVDREHLGNSGTQRGNRVIRCPDNLTADPEKALWVHAWEVFNNYSEGLNEEMVNYGLGYGRNALLFKSNQVVVAKHLVHEQEHALVLGCSEYDAVQLLDLNRDWNADKHRYVLSGTAVLAQGEVEFDDLQTFIDQLESNRRKSLGFLARNYRAARWHPLAKPA